MHLFSILPISVTPGDLPSIPSSDIDYFVGHELDAQEHWIFGDSSLSLIGLKSAGVLTPQASDHSFTADSVVIKNTYQHALVSTIADAATQTMVVIAKRVDNVALVKSQIICGSLAAPDLDLFGSGIYSSGVDGKVYYNCRGNNQLSTSYPAGAPVGTFAFLAFSEHAPAGTPRSIDTLIGSGAAGSIAAPLQKSLAPRNLALGNAFYSGPTFSGGPDLEVAEFIVYNRALTAAELAALYSRRKSILAKRGVTVA